MSRLSPFQEHEEDFLRRIREGEMTALSALFRENRKPVFALVMRNSGARDEAEDVLQEALVILWERVRADRFAPDARIQTFVYATAKNLWLRRLARKRRELPADPASDEPAADDPSSLDRLVNEERSAMVERAMGRLHEPCRSLLIAFYWEELSMEEIAKRFGLANAQTAKSKKYQCKEALKELLS